MSLRLKIRKHDGGGLRLSPADRTTPTSSPSVTVEEEAAEDSFTHVITDVQHSVVNSNDLRMRIRQVPTSASSSNVLSDLSSSPLMRSTLVRNHHPLMGVGGQQPQQTGSNSSSTTRKQSTAIVTPLVRKDPIVVLSSLGDDDDAAAAKKNVGWDSPFCSPERTDGVARRRFQQSMESTIAFPRRRERRKWNSKRPRQATSDYRTDNKCDTSSVNSQAGASVDHHLAVSANSLFVVLVFHLISLFIAFPIPTFLHSWHCQTVCVKNRINGKRKHLVPSRLDKPRIC